MDNWANADIRGRYRRRRYNRHAAVSDVAGRESYIVAAELNVGWGLKERIVTVERPRSKRAVAHGHASGARIPIQIANSRAVGIQRGGPADSADRRNSKGRILIAAVNREISSDVHRAVEGRVIQIGDLCACD